MPNPRYRLPRNRALLVGPGLACALVAGAVLAQPAPQVSQAVVQPIPSRSPGMKLNDALNKLARDPQDIEALIAAGRASLELGDVQAAIGFFQRADTLWPGSVRVRSGLAGAYVLANDPVTAIEMFNDADKLGPIDAGGLADRALAYDLVGDPRTAQLYYRRSLALEERDETVRRYGLSLAISGDRRGMEDRLGPLIQRQDKSAWRMRAFALAILGNAAEAQSIAQQTLPAQMASAVNGYLGFMPRLTRAQQAAAANLGFFPRASEIGRDDPRLARYSGPATTLASAAPVAAPVNQPGKGKAQDKGKSKDKNRAKDTPKPKPVQVAAAPPIPEVGREVNGKPVQLAMAEPPPVPKLVPVPPPPPPPPPPAPVPVTAPAPAPVQPAGPGFGSIEPGPASFDLRRTGSAAKPPEQPTGESLDEAFAGFTAPSREIEPKAGAVDIRKVRPPAPPPVAAKDPCAKEVPVKGAKSAKGKAALIKDAKCLDPKDAKDTKAKEAKSQPSRIWVQVATGRDKSALGFDWRKLARDNPELFKGLKSGVTAWGQSNRLLAGPFATQKEAAAFLAKLKKAGVSGAFVWSSP
ncbi:MAG: SPOR domain-containing protein, partial [Novosphingobium sp.]|nr:SPOR domain-containing protein [Novosphingobium sp.]